MLKVIVPLLALMIAPALALDVPGSQPKDRPAAGVSRETGTPGSAGPKDDGVVQRGTQPNPGEVRPGSAEGDSPSASAGTLREEQARRIFGLPVTAALVIAAAIVVLLALAGIVVPPARRRARARGNGTYGRR
jgi:hypothetical protein